MATILGPLRLDQYMDINIVYIIIPSIPSFLCYVEANWKHVLQTRLPDRKIQRPDQTYSLAQISQRIFTGIEGQPSILHRC